MGNEGPTKEAKEVSGNFGWVCVCVLHQKEAKQPAMGQCPIDEIDFCFLDAKRRGRELSTFSSAVRLIELNEE